VSTTRIPTAEITGVYGAIVKRFSKKLLGRVPESVGVYWHNPAVLKATMGMGAKAQKWKACDLSLKSFAHMAVAAQVGCSWCLDFGYFQAFNEARRGQGPRAAMWHSGSSPRATPTRAISSRSRRRPGRPSYARQHERRPVHRPPQPARHHRLRAARISRGRRRHCPARLAAVGRDGRGPTGRGS
jgi:hypothetical protein